MREEPIPKCTEIDHLCLCDISHCDDPNLNTIRVNIRDNKNKTRKTILFPLLHDDDDDKQLFISASQGRNTAGL